MVLSEHSYVADRLCKFSSRVVGEHRKTVLKSYQERYGIDDAVSYISDYLNIESSSDEAVQKLLHCYFWRWRQCYSWVLFFLLWLLFLRLFLFRLNLLRKGVEVIIVIIVVVVKEVEVKVIWIK